MGSHEIPEGPSRLTQDPGVGVVPRGRDRVAVAVDELPAPPSKLTDAISSLASDAEASMTRNPRTVGLSASKPPRSADSATSSGNARNTAAASTAHSSIARSGTRKTSVNASGDGTPPPPSPPFPPAPRGTGVTVPGGRSSTPDAAVPLSSTSLASEAFSPAGTASARAVPAPSSVASTPAAVARWPIRSRSSTSARPTRRDSVARDTPSRSAMTDCGTSHRKCSASSARSASGRLSSAASSRRSSSRASAASSTASGIGRGSGRFFSLPPGRLAPLRIAAQVHRHAVQPRRRARVDRRRVLHQLEESLLRRVLGGAPVPVAPPQRPHARPVDQPAVPGDEQPEGVRVVVLRVAAEQVEVGERFGHGCGETERAGEGCRGGRGGEEGKRERGEEGKRGRGEDREC